MRGPDDHLLETPDRDLLREVTGLEPAEPGTHAILPDARNRTTQRVGLSDVGGGIIVFTWPGELMGQAQRLYDGERAPRVLAAANERAWKVELRPHLAYFHSKPWERLYMHPRPTMTAEQYVARWAGPDAEKIGGHHLETIRDELWPWLLKRGYTTDGDVELLEPFIDRVEDANRDVHLRPGLALIRRWEREKAADKRRRGHLADEIRGELNRILDALGDQPLPTAPR